MDFKALKIGRALNLVIRTLPLTLVRLGALLIFWLAALVYLAIVGGIAWMVGQAVPLIGYIVFVIGVGGISILYRMARQYVLYMIKAAHIAVIAELVSRGSIPDGINQLAYGKAQVKKRFGEASAMFVVDRLVKGVVSTFTFAVYRITSIIPGQGARKMARVINRVLGYALNYVDEAILARSFWTDSDSVWDNAKDGVILYGMVWKQLLINAVALMLISYIPFLIVALVIAAPIGGLFWHTAGPAVGGWVIIAFLVLAYLVKMAFGDTFAMAAIVASYHDTTLGLEPDPQVSAKLESVSSKFRDLQQKASGAAGGPPRTDEQSSQMNDSA